MIKHYDIVISLGEFCLASWALRNCHIQKESMPLDWSGGWSVEKAGKGGLSGKVNLICSRFDKAFELEDLVLLPGKETNTRHAAVHNNRTGLMYLHDFPLGTPIEEYYPEYKKKYQRRVDRFYEKINESGKVLFFFMSRSEKIEDDYIREQSLKLREYFKGKHIDFLYIMHEPSVKESVFHYKLLAEGIHRYSMNVCYSPLPKDHADWGWGNRELYHPIIKNFCYSTYTKEFFSAKSADKLDASDCYYKNLIMLANSIESEVPSELEELLLSQKGEILRLQQQADILKKRISRPYLLIMVKYYGYRILKNITFGVCREYCTRRCKEYNALLNI